MNLNITGVMDMNIIKAHANGFRVLLILTGLITALSCNAGELTPEKPVATLLAIQHMEKFPDPWLMRKSDGAYRWSYSIGLVLLGVEKLYAQNGDETFADYIQSFADHYIDANGRIDTFDATEFNIDSINAGKMLFFLLERTGDQRYRMAMDSLRKQLEWHVACE